MNEQTATYRELDFLDNLRKERVPVTVYMLNGFQMSGIISEQDADTILLNVNGLPRMLYKTAVSTVCPKRRVNLNPGFLPLGNGA